MGVFFSNNLTREPLVFKIPTENFFYHLPSEVEDFCKQISDNKNFIYEADLSNNTYTEEALEPILNSLDECCNITIVRLRKILYEWTPESEKILEMVCKLLQTIQNLEELDLSDNCFKPQTLDVFTFCLERSLSIKAIRLNNDNLGSIGAKKIFESLKKIENLKLLVFAGENNCFEDEGAIALASLFGKLKTLRKICLSENEIGQLGILALSESFCKNPNLQVLKLRDNHINEKPSYISLSSALKRLRFLCVIDLGDCLLGNKGSKAIIESLMISNENLRQLYIQYNEIDENELSDLIVSFIIKRKSLEDINLTGNDINPESIEHL
mmetsp:Transcript_28936/g.28630  ORF Transcript_28936/g.28630 Transcript_28936/m.28630 type:complete len:326 (+) Transcript_28936:48-1025(+)